VSADMRFASPDVDTKFAWPATEIRVKRKPAPVPDRCPRCRAQRHRLRVLADARALALRWREGDDDVLMSDVVSALLEEDR
jgi:hypothetical protein